MHHIKLDATDSTNDYLKRCNALGTVPNLTVVSAEIQHSGKGQMGAKWSSEPSKNLMFSILLKNRLSDSGQAFALSQYTANNLIKVLSDHAIPSLAVKWPNDIMSGSRKIAGILIENSFRPDGCIDSIIGIGLNVNQTDFNALPQAGSMASVTGHNFDKGRLLYAIADAFEAGLPQFDSPAQGHFYEDHLFRKGLPTAFEWPSGERFMAMVTGTGPDGRLRLKLEDDTFQSYGVKEVRMLY